MPLYEYKCSCGKEFERYLKLADYKEPQLCECGSLGERKLSAARVVSDAAGYQCPVTGKWVEGNKAHRENLARQNCRLLEPGETEQVTRRRAEADAAEEELVAETAANLVEKMTGDERERLGRELSGGIDLTVTRS